MTPAPAPAVTTPTVNNKKNGAHIHNNNMPPPLVLLLFVCSSLVPLCSGLEFRAGAYEDLVIRVSEEVPADACQESLSVLQDSVSEMSGLLHSALGGRAHVRSVRVLLPASWPSPESCVPPGGVSSSVAAYSGRSDFTVTASGPGRTWTVQPGGCGRPARQVYITSGALAPGRHLGQDLLRHFAKYRYGVFEERGYVGDPVYPMCHVPAQEQTAVTGCSDAELRALPSSAAQVCSGEIDLESFLAANGSQRTTSAMFAPGLATAFCNATTHDRQAPTKHNFMCDRSSIMEVVQRHSDFAVAAAERNGTAHATPGKPRFTYSFRSAREGVAGGRYVLCVEDSRDMSVRESWSYLRTAVRRWAAHDLPPGAEVALISVNESAATTLLPLTALGGGGTRGLLSSNLPYAPGESGASACLECAMRAALKLLSVAAERRGAVAPQTLVLVAPGTDQNGGTGSLGDLVREARRTGVRVHTLNYPGVRRAVPLDFLAAGTGGTGHTVPERRNNLDTSLLDTYFDLANALTAVAAADADDAPLVGAVEVHRRRLSDDGRASVTGSFVMDPGLGGPARFALYAHDVESPLVGGLSLTSPSGRMYVASSDELISVKAVTLAAPLNETGTWTYRVDRYPGNPQPHFVQVTARRQTSDAVRAAMWLDEQDGDGPVTIRAEVRGGAGGAWPVLGARVQVTVTRCTGTDGTPLSVDTLTLLDSGGGVPDATRGDGVYSRLYAPLAAGVYRFEATVTDNGNTAYSGLPSTGAEETKEDDCCGGSRVPTGRGGVRPLAPFQRVLSGISLVVSEERASTASLATPGRVGDLRSPAATGGEDIAPRSRLVWTAPDTAARTVQRYDVRYATAPDDLVERWQLQTPWPQAVVPSPLGVGTEMTMALNLTGLGGPRALYFALRPLLTGSDGAPPTTPVSNWARVWVPAPVAPPPPPSAPQPSPSSEQSPPWPQHHGVNIGPPTDTRAGAVLGPTADLRLVLIAVGVLLAALLSVLCVCCALRRRRLSSSAKKMQGNKGREENSSNATNNGINSSAAPPTVVVATVGPTRHDVGVGPPQYYYAATENNDEDDDDEPMKKRFSLVHEQERRFAEELGGVLHHHQQRALSPYESWTASQLLHEHERRHSPVDVMYCDGGPPTPAPPVPPLPACEGWGPPAGAPPGYVAYGVLGHHHHHQQQHHHQPPYDLQGSVTSVASGERRRRNVTMV